MTARLVRSHGQDEIPLPGSGRIEYRPAAHGTYQGALRGTDTVVAKITEGVAEPVELTPGPWRVMVRPDHGTAWESWLIELTEGMAEPVDLVDLAPVVVVDGEKWAVGPPGASVTGAVDNGDQTVSFTLSDGTETAPVSIPPGPAGVGVASISDPDADSRVTVTYTDGSTSTVQAIRGAQGEPGEKGEPGEPGPASTVPGPAGPPGQVLTPESMLVVGPGRPDAPTTTGMTSAALAALPVGCEYRSTDGLQGAWRWQKLGTGWTVTVGDTGSRTITPPDWGGMWAISRAGALVTLTLHDTVSPTGTGPTTAYIPPGFRSPIRDGQIYPLSTATGSHAGSVQLYNAGQVYWWASSKPRTTIAYATRDPWPTTLPGASA